MKPRLVVFDLDGVLLDFCEVHYETLNRSIAEVAGPKFCISRIDHVSTYNGRSTRDKLSMLAKEKGLPSNLFDAIFARKQVLTCEAIGRIPSSHSLQTMLTTLRSHGYIVACATNCIRATLDAALDALGIRSLFDFTISNEDVKNPKPAADIYKLCQTRAGVHPGETIVFEDSPIGIAAANASGALVVCVPTPESLTEEFVLKQFTEQQLH